MRSTEWWFGYLLADDGNELLVLVLVSGEDDACSCGIADLADIGSVTPNEEAVVLLLGPNLPCGGEG